MTAKQFIEEHTWYREDMSRFIREEWWFYPEDQELFDKELGEMMVGVKETLGPTKVYPHRLSRTGLWQKRFAMRGFLHKPSVKRRIEEWRHE